MLFKKVPNSISCKMATVLKKKENKCLIFFLFVFFLSLEVFDIAGFQGHFSYVSKTSLPPGKEVSVLVWFCCVSVCGLVFAF